MRTKACAFFFFFFLTFFFSPKAPMRVELKAVISVVGGSRNLFGNGP